MGPSRFIRQKELTVWLSVPSTIACMRSLKMLTPAAFPLLRYSGFCGEPLPIASAEAWQSAAANSVIANVYGPTEATVACLAQICRVPPVVTKERGIVAIGQPFSGMQAAIVSSSNSFLPQGETGELAISGPQVAKGYLNDPTKTAARFPVINGDVWTDWQLGAPQLPAQWRDDTLAHLLLVPNPLHHPHGDFGLHESQVVAEAGERYTYSGIAFLDPQLFAGCKDGPFKLAPLLFAAAHAGEISGELYRGRWSDIGTPERLMQLEQQLRNDSSGSAR